MKVLLAVVGAVLVGIAYLAAPSAAPFARMFAVAFLVGIAATFLWPQVKRFPDGTTRNLPDATRADLSATRPIELLRLENEIHSTGGVTHVGYETMLNLRYIGRFRLVVSHRLDPERPEDLPAIERLVGPEFTAIVGPWPPDYHGRARPPVVASSRLPDLLDRLEAL